MWALGFAVLVTVRGRKLKNLGSRGWFEFLVSGLTVVVATAGVVGKSNSDLGLFENLPADFVATVVVATVVEVVVGVVVVVVVVVVVDVVVFACNILGFGKGFFKITTRRLVVAFFLLPYLIFLTSQLSPDPDRKSFVSLKRLSVFATVRSTFKEALTLGHFSLGLVRLPANIEQFW